MLGQRADPIPHPWQWVRAGTERGRAMNSLRATMLLLIYERSPAHKLGRYLDQPHPFRKTIAVARISGSRRQASKNPPKACIIYY